MKKQTTKLAALTAYDSSFATLFDKCGIDIILIGDSLGNVIKGDENTLDVSMKDMEYHTQNVTKNCKNALTIADMPYLSYEEPQQALVNAQILITAGADMVKIEGGMEKAAIVKILRNNNIRVCGHLGLQPQSINITGLKVQGKDIISAKNILNNAKKIEELGIELLVLECIPKDLAATITQQLQIQTIGIGAGIDVDGQILVSYDMLGITTGKLPKFVKNFGKHCGIIQATHNYIDAVKSLEFPTEDHSY